jgi:hypothetical protein
MSGDNSCTLRNPQNGAESSVGIILDKRYEISGIVSHYAQERKRVLRLPIISQVSHNLPKCPNGGRRDPVGGIDENIGPAINNLDHHAGSDCNVSNILGYSHLC